MATSQTAYINIDAQATSTKNGRSTTVALKPARNLANGTSANQADKSYYDQLTIAATGSPQNLDFSGAGLIDSNGDAITWVEMVGLIVKADDANTVNITIGNGTNPFDFGAGATGVMLLKPGESKVLINVGADPGYAITGGSADAIKFFIASGANQVFQILAFGRSA